MTVNTNNEMDILGWDDEVEEGSPFVLLPEGDYPFVVTNFERGIYEKPAGRESKVPANCPKAIVTFELTGPNGETTTLTENFFLYKKMQWKINQFFYSLGAQKGADGKVKMNWGSVLGAKGTAKVVINPYKDKKTGEDKQNNRIDTFNEPTQQAAAAGYQPPQQTYQAPPAQQPPAQQQPTTPFPTNTAPQTPPAAGNYNFGGQ
ncbi:hypothetical protein [Pseudolactococcus piscium]|uniref:Phage protein n=1 Tax=Pseudolactococcus piscium MKFS47 TaxID=297352 RepID=A0A0D6DZE6_9LACT|nr:hypothetical protein [Lactococcus piscium]CEN29364.1 Uncharacterized protein LACPI_2164 [Lactococcus piscium MKFS47]